MHDAKEKYEETTLSAHINSAIVVCLEELGSSVLTFFHYLSCCFL